MRPCVAPTADRGRRLNNEDAEQIFLRVTDLARMEITDARFSLSAK